MKLKDIGQHLKKFVTLLRKWGSSIILYLLHGLRSLRPPSRVKIPLLPLAISDPSSGSSSGSSSSAQVHSNPPSQPDTDPKPSTSKPLELSTFAKYFFPLLPRQVERYKREQLQTTEAPNPLCIEARTLSFEKPILGTRWKSCLSAGGARYFRHESGIYTDALNDETLLEIVEIFVTTFNQYISIDSVLTGKIPSDDFELVLEVIEVDNVFVCGYYMVNHIQRSVFWFDDFEIPSEGIEVKGIHNHLHYKYELESQYWLHHELFPFRPISVEVKDEIQDILIHGINANLTSVTSTIPYPVSTMEAMLALIRTIKPENGSQVISHVGSSTTIARLMCIFAHHRYMNYHGLPFVRLSAYESKCSSGTEIPTRNKMFIFKTLSLLLFGSSNTFCKKLEDLDVDGVVSFVQWSKFTEMVTAEWDDQSQCATVLLGINMAFLSINQKLNSAAIMLSSSSSFLSIAAILISRFLLRQRRLMSKDTAKDASEFLHNDYFGFEMLAVIFSLPYAFLMWGMLSFIGAFTFYCHSGAGL